MFFFYKQKREYEWLGSLGGGERCKRDGGGDHEYSQAIGWAQANGIAKGTANNEFAPDDLITVAQARAFLERYAQYAGIEMSEMSTMADKVAEEILDNADEVLAEFFGLELDAAA